MNIEVWFGENKVDDLKTLRQCCLDIGRDAGRVCYSKLNFETIREEKEKDKLIETLTGSGHHSPFDHPHITLYFKDIPKMFAMVLNNEKVYTTSEKSARYTMMKLSDAEQVLYDKWVDISLKKLKILYPNMDEKQMLKLAWDNARYLTSSFTPTSMLYTVSFRQISYLIHWFNDYIKTAPDNEFTSKLKNSMKEFNSQLNELFVLDMTPDIKCRKLSLFSKHNDFQDYFGDVYSTTYDVSFASFGHLHRHRSINYELFNLNNLYDLSNPKFFIPPMFEDVCEEWIADLESLKYNYPQAMLVSVHEWGHYLDFYSKAVERMCGHVLIETMETTGKLFEKYARNVTDEFLAKELFSNCVGKAKCLFPGVKCVSPCFWGPIKTMEKLKRGKND